MRLGAAHTATNISMFYSTKFSQKIEPEHGGGTMF